MKVTFNIERRIEKKLKDGRIYVIENEKAIKIHKEVINAIEKILTIHLGKIPDVDTMNALIELVELAD